MSKSLSLLMCLFLTIGQLVAQNEQDEFQRFGFKDATFKSTFTSNGGGVTIVKETTLYIKNYGASEARYIKETRNISMLNRVEVSNTHTIMDGNSIISIDLDKKTGTISQNKAKDFFGNMTNKEVGQLGNEMMDIMKAKTTEIGTRQVVGITCVELLTTADLVGLKTETIECKYKGFSFYTKSDVMGQQTTEEVTYFKEGDSGPSSVWKPEPGITLKKVSY